MTQKRVLPADPLGFIQECVHQRALYWTYHVNMRLAKRIIARDAILSAVDTYEMIEEYPDDKYLPSYLILARHTSDIFHVLFAADVLRHNVRVVTAYRPDPKDWQADLKSRRTRT